MFCKNCGNQINDDDAFCKNCGTPVGKVGVSVSVKEVLEDKQVRLSLKPTFLWGYQIMLAIARGIIGIIIIFCCSTNIFFNIDGLSYGDAMAYSLVISSVVVTICEIIKLFFTKKQYSKLSYEFYKTKIQYVDGFFNKEEKEVKYKYIREVTMTQDIFERMFGIGCIRLYTNASVATNASFSYSQKGKNGIVIPCIKNLSENFKTVKALIDELDGNC